MSSVHTVANPFSFFQAGGNALPSTQEDLAVIWGCMCPDNGFVPAGMKTFFFCLKKTHGFVRQESW